MAKRGITLGLPENTATGPVRMDYSNRTHDAGSGAVPNNNTLLLAVAAVGTVVVAAPAIAAISTACAAAPVSAPIAASSGGVLGALGALWVRK